MSRFPVASAVIAILALVGAVVIAQKMQGQRVELYGEQKARTEMKYFPILGMEKFIADLQWIRLIQDMGKPGATVDSTDKGKRNAKYFYQRADWITDFRPDADKIYEHMALTVSSGDRDLAIKLLEKGDRLSRNKKWKRSHYAAQFAKKQSVLAQKAADDPKTGPAAKEKFQAEADAKFVKAAELLKKSIEMGSSKTTAKMEQKWFRWQAQIKGYEANPLQNIVVKKEYYEKKSMEQMTTGAPGDGGNETGKMEPTLDSEAQALLFKECQKLALTYYNKLHDKKTKSAARNKITRNYAKLKKLFKSLKPTAPYSEDSLNFYAAGDFYDSATGERVKPYGVSWKAWKDLKSIVVFKGDYCQVTGMSRKDSDAQWEAWWKKNKDKK